MFGVCEIDCILVEEGTGTDAAVAEARAASSAAHSPESTTSSGMSIWKLNITWKDRGRVKQHESREMN